MVSKWGKFYKCSIALLCSLVLSFVFVGKSAEASNYSASTNLTISSLGTVSAKYWVQGFYLLPTSIDYGSTNASGDINGALNTYNYSFTAEPEISISGDIYQGSSNITEGYLNGTFIVNYSLNCSTYGGTQTGSWYMTVELETTEDNGVHVALDRTRMNGNVCEIVLVYVFNNYSITSGSKYCPAVLNIDVQTTGTGNLTLQSTASVTTGSSNLRASVMADAGTSIAGEIYAAIENSISVSDIIMYLNLIEDAAGDINVAVAHINEYLIPQVIQQLIGISTNTANIKINTDELVRLLTAFYNTWPSYSAQVLFYLDQLVNMNAEQSSIADEVQQEYSSKAAQSASEAAGMQAVLPQVDQSDFDIGSQLDSGTVTTLSAFWAMFPNNALIGTMFAIAIAGIAAGYFLYGKKQ